MTIDYFSQFNQENWQPQTPPKSDDPVWIERFIVASDKVKTNIANGWLWELNERLAKKSDSADVTREIVRVLNLRYQFLRDMLPYCTPDMHTRAFFDGTVESLVAYHSTVVNNKKPMFTDALRDLWFGDNAQRISAVEKLATVINTLNFMGSSPDLFGNMVINLAWDVQADNPDNTKLHISAAMLSLESGDNNTPVPVNTCEENKAWFILGKTRRAPVDSYNNAYGKDVLTVIQGAPSAVAATLLPSLLIHIRNSSGKNQPYMSRLGLVCAVDKELSKITDYDILRKWIPSQSPAWDAAEALDVPYHEACIQVAKKALEEESISVELPRDFVSASIHI